MIVYVLFNGYEETHVEAVFTSPDNAQIYLDRRCHEEWVRNHWYRVMPYRVDPYIPESQ